jgi:hypothetical protein
MQLGDAETQPLTNWPFSSIRRLMVNLHANVYNGNDRRPTEKCLSVLDDHRRAPFSRVGVTPESEVPSLARLKTAEIEKRLRPRRQT